MWAQEQLTKIILLEQCSGIKISFVTLVKYQHSTLFSVTMDKELYRIHMWENTDVRDR